jgi:folate-binding protein YgfZ
METNKAYITSNSFISISGIDCQDFLQNIITNDIKKATDENSIFASLLTPQGKFLFEFIIFKKKDEYLIESNKEMIIDLYNKLNIYKLRSKIKIEIEIDLISIDIPHTIFKNLNMKNLNLVNYKNYIIFEDPRVKSILARAVINQHEIKDFLIKLNVELTNEKYFYEKKLFNLGIPSKDIIKLQNKIFALEANFLELNGISQKKGCYIGQENTSRMHLKNKVKKRLLPIQIISGKVHENQKIKNEDEEIGEVLIRDPFPFALIKMNKEIDNKPIYKELKTDTANIKFIIPNWLNIF